MDLETTHPNLDTADDGIDRRGFLKCMAWAGSGVLFTLAGGIPKSFNLSKIALDDATARAAAHAIQTSSFSFVQISDSHIGFSKEANKNVIGTLEHAVQRINALGTKPDLLLHTGDLSHLSKDAEFDALDQILKGTKVDAQFFVPGEHDILDEGATAYKNRYGKGSKGDGWFSFDHKGVHFVGLVNVMNLKNGGLGYLGDAQLSWLADDLKTYSDSAPVVIFAHIPLWEVYPQWGWGTDDGARALEMLKRFGSVTVLNGHIHQSLQKVEGNISFHTAMSTAFPQNKPGIGGPGPLVVPAGTLESVLGIRQVNYIEHESHLAVIDTTLAQETAEVGIDNFAFSPATQSIGKGASIKWTNRDDINHSVVSVDGVFKSKSLDTNDSFEWTFKEPGTYRYVCGIHTHMKGEVHVN